MHVPLTYNQVRGPFSKLRTKIFGFMPKYGHKSMQKKLCSVTYSMEQQKEVRKVFITLLY